MELLKKTYVNIKDIQRIFGFDFYKAREVHADAMKIQSKNYSCLEKKVLLQKVLEVQGIEMNFWLNQQRGGSSNGNK